MTSKESKKDFLRSLEHIMIEGTYQRHYHWRVKEYCKRRKQQKRQPAESMIEQSELIETVNEDSKKKATDTSNDNEEEEEENENEADEKPSAVSANLASSSSNSFHVLHASDIRVYPNYRRGFENPLWPDPKPKSVWTNVEDEQDWDRELGDHLHPIAFFELRLSQQTHNASLNLTTESADDEEEDDLHDLGRNHLLDYDRSDCNVSSKHAGRAFLVHCWERAVHAVSTVYTPSQMSLPLPAMIGKTNWTTSTEQQNRDLQQQQLYKCNCPKKIHEAEQLLRQFVGISRLSRRCLHRQTKMAMIVLLLLLPSHPIVLFAVLLFHPWKNYTSIIMEASKIKKVNKKLMRATTM